MKIALENDIDTELEVGRGYSLAFCLEKSELEKILDMIHAQWIERVREKYPENYQQFSEIGIARYHELAHLIDHGSTWVKEARIFSKQTAAQIKQMSFIRKIEEKYGPIEIVDEENIGYEEFDWRLVRPNHPSDVGPFHADIWFRRLGHGVNPPKNLKAIKVWVALCCEPGKNGLLVVPHSQKQEWRYHGEFRHGFVKPQIDEDVTQLPTALLNTRPGDAVVFHEKLLHAGALNRGKYTRISMEFMVFVRK